jgi:hypothetical protein
MSEPINCSEIHQDFADRLAKMSRRFIRRPSLSWSLLKLFLADAQTWDEVLDKDVDPATMHALGLKEVTF